MIVVDGGSTDKTAKVAKRMKKVGKVVFLPDCVVISSGRRSREGVRYFLRAGWADFEFFVLGKRKFKKFTGSTLI